jgi:hypothetical protein
VPEWLTVLATVSLVLAGLSALVMVIDIASGHRQHMWIMNVVWPLTALYSGPLGLWAYFAVGRRSTHRAMPEAMPEVMPEAQHTGHEPPASAKPFWQSVGLATTHCGSGCTLGDLLSEWALWLFPLTLFGSRIFAAWVVDYAAAFVFGIAFQYFTITPMKHLSPARGLAAALKADTLTVTAWEVGMFGWMAIATFLIFPREQGGLDKGDPVFWFMLQIAMLAGFVTSYPVTWWLVRVGIKEQM